MVKNLEKATDMETVMFLISHIERPCSAQVGDKRFDLRDFYIRIAEQVLQRLENPWAIDLLKSEIEGYTTVN